MLRLESWHLLSGCSLHLECCKDAYRSPFWLKDHFLCADHLASRALARHGRLHPLRGHCGVLWAHDTICYRHLRQRHCNKADACYHVYGDSSLHADLAWLQFVHHFVCEEWNTPGHLRGPDGLWPTTASFDDTRRSAPQAFQSRWPPADRSNTCPDTCGFRGFNRQPSRPTTAPPCCGMDGGPAPPRPTSTPTRPSSSKRRTRHPCALSFDGSSSNTSSNVRAELFSPPKARSWLTFGRQLSAPHTETQPSPALWVGRPLRPSPTS